MQRNRVLCNNQIQVFVLDCFLTVPPQLFCTIWRRLKREKVTSQLSIRGQIYIYAPLVKKAAPFHLNTFLLKSFLRKLKEGVMLINLPDALILQRKSQSKTLQKHSTCTFWPTQEYPSSTQSPRVLCNRHFIRCALSVIQSTSPFLKCFCVPFTTVSPSSVDTLRHYDKNFRRHHWRKNYFKVDNLSSNKELIVSPTIKKKKKRQS